MRRVYLIGAILGGVLPYASLVVFLLQHGFDLGLFVGQLFATPAAAMFTTDLLLSSLIFWIYLYREGRRLEMGNLWVYVALNLSVGLSLALPLFLYFRVAKIEG